MGIKNSENKENIIKRNENNACEEEVIIKNKKYKDSEDNKVNINDKENNDKNYNRNQLRNYISDNDNENESNNAKANDRISKILNEKENKNKTLEEEIADLKKNIILWIMITIN